MTPEPTAPSGARWTLLTNHGAALLQIARHADATIREVADAIGVTERAAARILKDLRDAGYLRATRVGRRNVYQLDPSRPLRHVSGEGLAVAHLLQGLVDLEGQERGGGLARESRHRRPRAGRARPPADEPV